MTDISSLASKPTANTAAFLGHRTVQGGGRTDLYQRLLESDPLSGAGLSFMWQRCWGSILFVILLLFISNSVQSKVKEAKLIPRRGNIYN